MYQQVFHWVRTAYLDAPLRQLTVALVKRSCGVEAAACAQVLDDLVRAGFLGRTAGGTYIRRMRETLPDHTALPRAQ